MTKTIRGGKSPGFDYDGRRAYNRRSAVARGSRLKRLTNRSERRQEPRLAHNELQLLAVERELDEHEAVEPEPDAYAPVECELDAYDALCALCEYDDYM